MTTKQSKRFMALAVAALSLACAFGDGPRRMIGTASGTAGVLSTAITWAAEDGGTVILPGAAGSDACVYVITGASKLSASDFPNVPAELANPSVLNTNRGTIGFPQLTIKSGAKGLRINGDGNLILNGGYLVPSGVTFPLAANAAGSGSSGSTSYERNVKLINSSTSTLTGEAGSIISYSFGISTDTTKLLAGTIVDSTLTIGSGNASAFKGKYVIADAPTRTISDVGYTGRAHLKFESATAFGDPTSELADAVTLGERAYLSLGASVVQYATRGITVTAGKKGGIAAASGEELTLTAPVTCGSGATFQKIGAGAVALAGDCTGVSAMEVTEGTLVLGVDGQFANGLAVTVKPGATLVQNKYVGNIAVTCEEGGTYTKNIHYLVPYSNATGTSTPLDFTAGVPELPLSIRLSDPIEIASFAPDFETNRIDVAKLPSDTTATVADFGDATEKTYGLPKTSFEIEAREGYKALILVAKPVVWSLSQLEDNTESGGLNGTAANWANNAVAQAGYDYLLTNDVKYTGTTSKAPRFNGDSLTVANINNLRMTSPDVDIGDASFFGRVNVYYNNGSLKGKGYTGITRGSIFVAKDAALHLQTKRSNTGAMMTNRVAVAVTGTGELWTYGYEGDFAGGMPVCLTGDNSGFSGKLVVTCNEPATETTGTTLHLGLGTSFGGAMAEPTADGVYLAQYSFLHPEQTMTLDAANRGITIKAGGFDVKDGVALTVAAPVTVTGKAYKKGAGELALGGAATFESGKYFVVQEGSVRALSDAAVAGDFRFADGTTVVLDPAAGLVNGFTGSFSVTGEGTPKVTVAVDTASPAFNLDAPVTLPICTLPSSAGDLTDSFSFARVQGCKASLVKENVTVDGTACVRYSAKYTLQGFTVLFR